MNRRTLFAALSSAMVLLGTVASAQTLDDYPNHPIRIIVPQAAGSGVDLQARVLAQKMGELLGQPGVVENRPGANAILGMEAVAKAQPDGYTLVPGGNWPSMRVVERLERELGKPVLANNAVSLWAGLRMLKRGDKIHGYGRLLSQHLAHEST
jgi:hypothetical protein